MTTNTMDAFAGPLVVETRVDEFWETGERAVIGIQPVGGTSEPATMSGRELPRFPESRDRALSGIQPNTRAGIRAETAGLRVYGDNKSLAVRCVLAAERTDEVIDALAFGECRSAADRIRDLDEMTRDGDPDEPEIVVGSLRELALFLLSKDQLVEPELTLDPNGLMNAEWASGQGDIVAMKFLPGGMIRFAAVSAAGTSDPELRAHDELPREEALRAVLAVPPFRSVLAKPRATA